MRRFLFSLLVFVAAVYAGAETIQDQLLSQGIQVAKKRVDATDFELRDLNDISRKLSSYKGHVVFLNFWATWCGPCRYEMPSMQRLYTEFKDDGLVIVAVDLQESKAQVKSFVEEYNLTFPVLLDKNGKVGAIYGARSIPTTFLLDRDGYIFARAIGAKEWDTPQMVRIFRKILGEGIAYEEIKLSNIQEAAENSGPTKELLIEMYNWGFDVPTITIRKGERVRLTVKSRQGTHGLTIPALGVATGPIRAGQEKTVEFTAAKSGDIRVGCNVFCGIGHILMRTSLKIRE